MKEIVVYGAGAYGQEVSCLIRKINSRLENPRWKFIGFFDDDESLWGTENSYGKILGGCDALGNWHQPLDVVIAIANVSVLKNLPFKINNPDLSYPNIIDPDTVYLDKGTVIIGHGNVIGELSRIAPNVHIGNFNIIVNDCVFGHDDVIGDCNVFFPDSRLSGHVSCGDCNTFGVRSTVLQGVRIGNNVKLAPGCMLMNDTQDGLIYRGNPARKVNL